MPYEKVGNNKITIVVLILILMECNMPILKFYRNDKEKVLILILME